VAVARMPLRFVLGEVGVAVDLPAAVLIAPLVLGEPLVRIEGAVLAGSWPVASMIEAFGQLDVGGTPICSLGAIFESPMREVCKLVDVTIDDGPGTCDALSLGMAFDAGPVVPGPIDAHAVEPAVCPPITCRSLLER
jgi:hypothetical protein